MQMLALWEGRVEFIASITMIRLAGKHLQMQFWDHERLHMLVYAELCAKVLCWSYITLQSCLPWGCWVGVHRWSKPLVEGCWTLLSGVASYGELIPYWLLVCMIGCRSSTVNTPSGCAKVLNESMGSLQKMLEIILSIRGLVINRDTATKLRLLENCLLQGKATLNPSQQGYLTIY